MNYRSDIQVLRGISVLFVVLYHLGFQVFKSGFLGVDIFFVISGFLMAVLYDKEKKLHFLERRAKRLLPAYYVVILATLIISFSINTLNEIRQVVEQTIYASLFLSNVGFWLQNSYFDTSAFKPLLHLWSLGVEIQFYLIVPFLAWFFYKSKSFIFVFFLASLALCFLIVSISPKTSFFMMPLRIWEFLIGYGAAIFFTMKGNVRYTKYQFLGLVGLIGLVFVPFISIEASSLSFITGHPGLLSLIISLSTGLVLIFGLSNKLSESFFGKVFVTLGKYSYSIYLVHFPIIVLYLSKPFGGTSITIENLSSLLTLFFLIAISAFLLYRYVECYKSNFNFFKLSIVTSFSLIVLSLMLSTIKSNFISIEEKYIFEAFTDRSQYRCGKITRIINPSAISCELTGLEGNKLNKKIMLVGNSHADSIKSTFTDVAKENNSSLHFLVSNEPLMKGGLLPEIVINEAKSKGITHIYLHHSAGAFSYEIIKSTVDLAEVEGMKVVFLEPVPVWPEHIPEMMYKNIKNNNVIISKTKQQYFEEYEYLFSNISKINNSNFKRLSIVDEFCNPNCLYQDEGGRPLYFDSNHLTLTGSKLIRDSLLKSISE